MGSSLTSHAVRAENCVTLQSSSCGAATSVRGAKLFSAECGECPPVLQIVGGERGEGLLCTESRNEAVSH